MFKLRLRSRVYRLTIVTSLMAGSSVLCVTSASAITPSQCLTSSDIINSEVVMTTFGSAFQLKFGKKDPKGYGLRHINEGHPYTGDLDACVDDVLAYGVDSPADAPNRKRVIGPIDGAIVTVVYLPASPPTRNSIVTAFTNGSPTNQRTLCKNLIG